MCRLPHPENLKRRLYKTQVGDPPSLPLRFFTDGAIAGAGAHSIRQPFSSLTTAERLREGPLAEGGMSGVDGVAGSGRGVPVLLQFAIEGLASDAQEAGGLGLIALGMEERLEDDLPLHLFHRQG